LVVTKEHFLTFGFLLVMSGVYRPCSKPIFGLPTASDSHLQYKWTNCVTVFVVPEDIGGRNELQLGKKILKLKLFLSVMFQGMNDVQIFIFKYTSNNSSLTETNFRISNVEYICQQCLFDKQDMLPEKMTCLRCGSTFA
jgi:hypothetical protein